MKQKKTARFSNSDSSASALKVPESKQSSQIVTVTNTLGTQQNGAHMSTETTTTKTNTTATRKTAKPSKAVKALTLATCGSCRAEYKAEAWHTENLCPDCYAKAHPKTEKDSTTAQTMTKVAAGIALAVLITKGTHYAVSVIDPSTGTNLSKVYTLRTHGEALTLAEKMYKNRGLADILDATDKATDTEATLAGE